MKLRYNHPEFLRQPPFAIHCCLAGLDNNADWTPNENDVFLKKILDKDLLVTLNRESTGHTEAHHRDGVVDITSLFPRRMTLTSVLEKPPDDRNVKSVTFCHQLVSGVNCCVARLS